jgi:hypothetical protein
MCEEYTKPQLAGQDLDGATKTAGAALLPLLPLFNHTREVPLDYDRDIAPRISLRVTFWGYDRIEDSPDQCANFTAFVECNDLNFLRALRQNAADVWNDGDTTEFPIYQTTEEEMTSVGLTPED